MGAWGDDGRGWEGMDGGPSERSAQHHVQARLPACICARTDLPVRIFADPSSAPVCPLSTGMPAPRTLLLHTFPRPDPLTTSLLQELFDQLSHPTLLRLQRAFIRLTGFTIPLIRGRGIFQYSYGLIPRRHPLHTVMGPAIHVDKVESPSPQQIDALHRVYTEALQRLYNENKDKYARPVSFEGEPLEAPPLRVVA